MNTRPPRHARKLVALILGAALSLAVTNGARADETASKAAPAATAVPRLFGGKIAGVVKTTATVEKIDHKTREVVLKGENGELHSVVAGPEVKRLDEIHAGDTIEIVYAESVTLLAGDAALAPGRDAIVEGVRADKTEKPGGAAVASAGLLVTVTHLDAAARTATLEGPERTVTVNVGPDAPDFDTIKVGDRLLLTVTRTIAASVVKTAPAAKK